MGVGSYPFLILIVKATQKNNQKVKKIIKSVDKDHKRVYNIIINQIQGERNKAQ